MIEDGRLARAKVEKHRECWPTAFYEQDCEGDPIFVDRMGILGAYHYLVCGVFSRMSTNTFTLTPTSPYAIGIPPDLGRLKKEPLALDMKDMVTYYVQTMESRRRLLFPQLSRATGRLVTQVNIWCMSVSLSHQLDQ